MRGKYGADEPATPSFSNSVSLKMIRSIRLLPFWLLLFAGILSVAAKPAARVTAAASFPAASPDTIPAADTVVLTKYDSLFNKLQLGKLGLGRRAFDYAIVGYNILKAKNRLSNQHILSIADMTTASGRKRFFVIDMKNSQLLFVTYVAHGRNSGLDKTLHFSNEAESFKSSVGFYITSLTDSGKHGYSMRLEGQEIGYNHNARERDIVVHGADYVGEAVVKSQGYIGRSLGCPALSQAVYKPIIDRIKNGSCLFIYGNDTKYIINSQLLKRPLKLAGKKAKG